MAEGRATPNHELQEITEAQLMRYREQYRDSAVDASLNSQPIDVYLYYARHERTRELSDHRPAPDAPWVALGKRLTGRADEIIPVPRRVVRATPSGGWSAIREVGASATELTSMDTHRKTMSAGTMSTTDMHASSSSRAEKDLETQQSSPQPILTEAERESTYRLLRVASWQVVFYLITTDMMGWFTASKTFETLGFTPGALVYTGFFLLAFGGGQMLWRVYMNLDSEEFPIRSYADLAERTYGPMAKYSFNILQSIQLLFNVGMFIVMQGQALAQIIEFKFCYIGLNIFFAVAGVVFTQIRTIRNVAWFSNINVFANLIIMFLTAFGVAMYDPIPSQSGHLDLSEPIKLYAWIPEGRDWHQQISGVMLAVFAYGGAMIFVEFLAEMRRPADFWKAALCAQMLCWATYMFFGLFTYSMQGQYSAIMPTVNMASIAFQAITSVIGMICAFAISTLYAHVGCKIVYRIVLRGYFRAPSLTSKQSTVYWAGTVVAYFTAAWAIGSAIPNITDINVIVGAACALQFTYTFPSFLLLGHWLQVDAAGGDVPWEPGMEPYSNRKDTWRDWSRWSRAIKRWWYFKLGLLMLVLGSLTLAGLGIYSGAVAAKSSFQTGRTTAFSCRAPGEPLHR